MSHDRRSVLAAIGLTLPFGLSAVRPASAAPVGLPPALRLRSFEEAVREAFAQPAAASGGAPHARRIEVGHSDLLQAGVQGCHNDRAFAGFPAGHLRIVRVGSEPGPAVGGVRLYVCTVDVVVMGGRDNDESGRPLDFATVPPAPVLIAPEPPSEPLAHRPTGKGVPRGRA